MEEFTRSYYVPDVSEFRIGFEYEFHGTTTGGHLNLATGKHKEPDIKIWDKCIVSLDFFEYRSLNSIKKLITGNQIRVKHLNRITLKVLVGNISVAGLVIQ